MNYQRAPKWDKDRPIFLKLGFIFAIALSFMAFNYTSYNAPNIEVPILVIPEDDGEVIPPIMVDRKKVLPPPEPVIIPLDVVEDIPTPEFIEDLPPEPNIDSNIATSSDVTAPMVLPKYDDQAEEIIHSTKIVENNKPVLFAQEMPIYNTCDHALEESERRECTNGKMLAHIYDKLKYPTFARENGIEGTVVVSFVVDKSGKLDQLKIMRDIGGGCGEAVINVLNSLGNFTPGIQNGKPVSVIYRIPVKFELDG